MPPAQSPNRRRTGRPGSPRARLFVALEVPEPVRGELVRWRDVAIAGREELRAVAPAAMHVTLVFLGYRPEKEIPGITETAFAPLAEFDPIALAAEAVRPVPRGRPRLFALALADAEREGAAAALQAAVSESLAERRLHRPEKRPFWPHLTLARVKRGRRAAPLDPAEPPPATPFEAAEIVLYRSHLRPQGAHYEPLAHHRLGS